jgi:hypothetical protein
MSSSEERESFLNDDPEISSQRWALLSFISPENVLNRKDPFFFSAFVRQYEFHMRVKTMESFLVNTVKSVNESLDKEATRLEALDLSGAAAECRKSTLKIDSYIQDFQEFVKTNQKELIESKIHDEYTEFMFKNGTKLEDDFYAKNDFRTTVRGLKIRGSYSTKEEAESRAKKLQKMDPDHNIFVGQIGKWLPWDPAPSAIADHEYAEEQLNTLMKKYKENEEQRDVFNKEQRERIRNNSKKNVMNMSGSSVESETQEDSSIPSLGTNASEFSGMFSGPADLAISRKMEKSE